MTARLIKLAVATLIFVIATISANGPGVKAAVFDGADSSYSTATEMELHSSMPTLLAWASDLSGYPAPDMLPRVAYCPSAFFRDRVCGGAACKVAGWYNDQDIIYLDEKYRYEDQDDFANSLLLHELVHFLQHHSGRFDSLSCNNSLVREREAYAVQNSYLANVWYSIRFVTPKHVSCAYELDRQ